MTTQRRGVPVAPHRVTSSLSSSDQPPSATRDDEIVALRQELAALRAEFAAFRAAMTSTSYSKSVDVCANASDPIANEREREPADGLTSRRRLLKWGGVGAAAALAAAGGAALTTQTAHAANGGNLVLGADNTAEQQTTLRFDGTTASTITLFVNGSNASSTIGVDGLSGTNGIGVLGQSHGSTGTGVFGESDNGNGVVGFSTFGPSLVAGGAGRLQQVLTPFNGPPTSGSYTIGEQVRDTNGDLFICVGSGSPGTWRKVAALDTAFKGGAIGFLSTPIRIYDSRATGGPLSGDTLRLVQVTGVSVGGVSVPANATGAIGNLTVTGTTSSGFLVIYPRGSNTPGTSTVNYLSGQTTANSFAVRIGTAGQVAVHAFQSGHCQFIVDIIAFTE